MAHQRARAKGMTISFTERGLFDFARSRGTISMQSPVGMTERFIPPTTYLKFPATGSTLPKGKSWVALPAGASSAAASAGVPFGPFTGDDPADLLASLTAGSSSVTRLGASTVRGVPVTGFAVKIDPAKVTATIANLGSGAIPVDVWVDGQNLVRREKLSLTVPGGSGAPAGTSLVLTTDFYDFGVPVRVSAPPAAEIADMSQLMQDGAASSGVISSAGSFTSATSASGSPPPVSGTLTAEHATAAKQAVAAFWSALGRHDAAAVARTVLPAQRSCVRSELDGGAPTVTVSALHITSARPAGNARATVRFTVQAQAKLGGVDMPVMPQNPGDDGQWLVTAQVSGHWYVDIARSTAIFFGGTCP